MSTCAEGKRHKRTNTLKEHTRGERIETRLSVPTLLRCSLRIIAYPRTKPGSQRHKHRSPLPRGAGVPGEESTAQINPHLGTARGEAAGTDKHSLPRMLAVRGFSCSVCIFAWSD